MEIEVKLYAALRRYRPGDAGGAPHHPFFVTMGEGSRVASLAAHLGIPDGMVNAAAVNGMAVELDAILQPGDQVKLFPPTAGG